MTKRALQGAYLRGQSATGPRVYRRCQEVHPLRTETGAAGAPERPSPGTRLFCWHERLDHRPIDRMASEKLQMNHGGVPSSGETSGSGRSGIEVFSPSGQRVSTERSQPTCLVVENDHTMLHLVMNYLGEHHIRAISASGRDQVAGLLVREEPNLVILDLRLGPGGGARFVPRNRGNCA